MRHPVSGEVYAEGVRRIARGQEATAGCTCPVCSAALLVCELRDDPELAGDRLLAWRAFRVLVEELAPYVLKDQLREIDDER